MLSVDVVFEKERQLRWIFVTKHWILSNSFDELSANLRFRAHDDNSPIHMAALNGYTKCIRALLGVHANILDVKNKNGVYIGQFTLCIRNVNASIHAALAIEN